MEIRASSIVRHPRDRVYRAFRDRLPDIAAYMPNVKRVDVVAKEQLPDGVRLHNVWYGKGEIPKIAQIVVKPEILVWDDYAVWHDSAFYCDWRIGIRVFNESFKCSGTNRLTEEGPHTRVSLLGDLELDLRDVPGVPRLLATKLRPQIEAFIVKLIRPNLEETNVALGRFLDANP